MKVALTGGGTGGHIYPALEVGRELQVRGAELIYLGSLRGQEGKACERIGMPFFGFPSEPLWSLKSPSGWRALWNMVRATRAAKVRLQRERVDVVFATGGYSAGPIMAAARSLGIPYVIHDGNSVPGRATRMFAPKAAALACTFRKTLEVWPNAERTGHPVRADLRAAAAHRVEEPLVLVVGGSQGARYLNETVPLLAGSFPDMRWLHATGPGQFDNFKNAAAGNSNYELVPYLEAAQITDSCQRATLAIARSGSTLAEFAAFRLPSVLVPLPTSADDHQRMNALEFVEMGAATMVEQSVGGMQEAVEGWLNDPVRRLAATKALAEWDIPDATARLASIIERQARKNA